MSEAMVIGDPDALGARLRTTGFDDVRIDQGRGDFRCDPASRVPPRSAIWSSAGSGCRPQLSELAARVSQLPRSGRGSPCTRPRRSDLLCPRRARTVDSEGGRQVWVRRDFRRLRSRAILTRAARLSEPRRSRPLAATRSPVSGLGAAATALLSAPVASTASARRNQNERCAREPEERAGGEGEGGCDSGCDMATSRGVAWPG